jgi:methyl-accepting chemotaxis protein
MRFKFGIKSKMLLFILITSTIIFVGAIGYISIDFKDKALINAKTIAENNAKEYGNSAVSMLNGYMLAARTMASEFELYYTLPETERRTYFSNILTDVLIRNDEFISTWSICEPNTIDSLDSQYINALGSTFMGNFSPTYFKDEGEIKIMTSTDTVLFQGEYYTLPKTRNNETILDPYYYSYTGDDADAVLETNLIVPIHSVDEAFIGVVGIDVTLETFNELNNQIKPFETGYAFLLSNNATLVAHPIDSLAGEPIDAIPSFERYPGDIKDKIKNGESAAFIIKDAFAKEESYIVFTPIQIGRAETPWAIAISVPVKTIMQQANRSIFLAAFVGLIGLLILSLVIWLIATTITNPITRITNLLKKISKGEISKNDILHINSKDEIGDIANSVNSLITGLESTVEFSNEIGKGNLDARFELLSEEDILGKSLLDMRQSLKLAQEEEEIGRIEDQKRNWATQGEAKFGELLRENNDNMEDLSYSIVSNLVKYVEASQCAFFMINNDNPNDIHFELIATIAFGRRKHITQRVEIGESLIGRAAEEGKTIHLDSIPDDYISITTGITGERPKHLLVVPMKINDIVYGVMELISYNPFENYQIEFIEKIGESIASTISGVKISARTAQLLEQSKKQADELAQQEEEMRQNMEEMQATQEEAAKRESEMKGLIDGMNTITLVAEYDLDGQISQVNDELLKLYGLSKHQVLGKYHGSLSIDSVEDKAELEELWIDLQKGKSKKRKHKLIVGNKEIWLREVYTPILDQDGDPIKVLSVSTDITEIIKMEEEIEQIEAEIKEMQEG